MNGYTLDPGILLPAWMVGMVVLLSHVPLGRQVLARGIIFMDLAIAQMAALGVVAAHALELDTNPWAVQAAALCAALAGAAMLQFSDRRWPERQEAIIGSSFVLAASLGMLLLAHDPHAGEYLRELLVGQILWVNLGDLLPLAVITGLFLLLSRTRRLLDRPLGFYAAFAVLVTLSVQLVGVYLVFASLILPALASPRRSLPAWLIGTGGYALGLVASALWDLPSGAAIVCAIAVCAGVGGLWLRREAIRY